MSFRDWKSKSESFEGDRLWQDEVEERERAKKIRKIRSALIDFGQDKGHADKTVQKAIDDLFLVMAPWLYLYVFVGHPALAASISNDATLAWLDTDWSGKTVRERLVSQLKA